MLVSMIFTIVYKQIKQKKIQFFLDLNKSNHQIVITILPSNKIKFIKNKTVFNIQIHNNFKVFKEHKIKRIIFNLNLCKIMKKPKFINRFRVRLVILNIKII